MDLIADIAEQYSSDEMRVSHEQNIILPHVALADLKAVYDLLVPADLATANSNLISDIIACPGLDYCALANARSIPVAQKISERFADLARQRDIGELKLKISGCINACGHHHVGHIGILGVEKKGEELYQITLGGSADENTTIGEIIGRGFGPDEITDAIETVVETYLAHRLNADEKFLDAYRRLGPAPFKEVLYAQSVSIADQRHTVGPDLLNTLPRRTKLIAPRIGASLNARLRGQSRAGGDRICRSRRLCRPYRRGVVVRRRIRRCLLHLIAAVDQQTPVLFLDTGKHFGETLEYRDATGAYLRPRRCALHPAACRKACHDDPDGELHKISTDRCCAIRKVEPMARAVIPFDAWFTGRKRFQAVDPCRRCRCLRRLATASASIRWPDGPRMMLPTIRSAHALPEHPLIPYGYFSVGCAPCTEPSPPEDQRGGRWKGQAKVECGIHLGGLEASLTDSSL